MQKEQPSWSLLSRHQSCIPTEGLETLIRTSLLSVLVDFFGFNKYLEGKSHYSNSLL